MQFPTIDAQTVDLIIANFFASAARPATDLATLPPRAVSSMLVAADFLGLDAVIDELIPIFHTHVKGKTSTEDIRALFGVESDFTEEEERDLRHTVDWITRTVVATSV